MPARLSPAQLDEILALQLTIAWSGEAAGEPRRLSWWKSDLVDSEGGGDLFKRLIPRTAIWASLGLVREAAIRVDKTGRETIAKGDQVWTPFHFGFAIDEQLQDRLEYHRNRQNVPADVLGAFLLVGGTWSKAALESLLGSLGTVKVAVTPGGRKVETPADSAAVLAAKLAAALLPLTAEYPMPYWEVPA